MDFEKRQAKGFAKFDVPEAIRDRALELVSKAERAQQGELGSPGVPPDLLVHSHLVALYWLGRS